MYTNAQILSAILSTFLQPVVNNISSSYLKKIPFLGSVENKIKSMGFASPNWSLSDELAPFSEVISSSMIEPMLNKYISNVPDESLPKIAHSLVDKAISNGELRILDGYITLDMNDLTRLKNLLNWNLPITETDTYKVITEQPLEENKI